MYNYGSWDQEFVIDKKGSSDAEFLILCCLSSGSAIGVVEGMRKNSSKGVKLLVRYYFYTTQCLKLKEVKVNLFCLLNGYDEKTGDSSLFD